MSKIDLEKYMNLFEKKGDYDNAILAYQKEISQHPYNGILYYRICFCAFEIHNKEIFEYYFNSYSSWFQEETEISLYLSIYYYYFNWNIDELKNILFPLDDSNIPIELVSIKLWILLYEWNYQEVINRWKIHQNTWHTMYYTIQWYYLQGEYYEAYKIINQTQYKNYPYLFDLHLRILWKLWKRYKDEFILQQKKIEEIHFDSMDYNALGNSYFTLWDYKKAIYFYSYVAKKFPHDNYAFNGIGNIYIALWDYKKARKFYTIGLNNLDWIYINYSYIGIAKTYIYEWNFLQAYKILKNIINYWNKNPTVYYEISKCCFFWKIWDDNLLLYIDTAIHMKKNFWAAKRLKKKIIHEKYIWKKI